MSSQFFSLFLGTLKKKPSKNEIWLMTLRETFDQSTMRKWDFGELKKRNPWKSSWKMTLWVSLICTSLLILSPSGRYQVNISLMDSKQYLILAVFFGEGTCQSGIIWEKLKIFQIHWEAKGCTNLKNSMPLSVVMQNFDYNAQETEAEGSMSPRAAWGYIVRHPHL